MYSAETSRLPITIKSSKETQPSSTVTHRVLVEGKKKEAKQESSRTPKKQAPRRPLMRGPPTNRPTRNHPPKESEIHTMVENVDMVRSPCHVLSPDTSAKPTPRNHLGLSPRTSRNPFGPLVVPRSSRSAHINHARKPPNDALNLNLRLKLHSPLGDDERKDRCPYIAHRSTDDVIKSAGDPELKDRELVKSDISDEKKKKGSGKTKVTETSSIRSEVTRLVKELCGGDSSAGKTERTLGAKNAQLLCVKSTSSPRQHSTPQLLRILEETIQKKVPKGLIEKPSEPNTIEKFRLPLNINEETAQRFFEYRTKFVQHMLTSPLYANTSIIKPWKMISSISEQIIDELLISCSKEMQLEDLVMEMYRMETQ